MNRFRSSFHQATGSALSGAHVSQNRPQQTDVGDSRESHDLSEDPDVEDVSAIPCESQLITAQTFSGEGGIRTPGKILLLRGFSKAVLSTTQPPLQYSTHPWVFCLTPFDDWRISDLRIMHPEDSSWRIVGGSSSFPCPSFSRGIRPLCDRAANYIAREMKIRAARARLETWRCQIGRYAAISCRSSTDYPRCECKSAHLRLPARRRPFPSDRWLRGA